MSSRSMPLTKALENKTITRQSRCSKPTRSWTFTCCRPFYGFCQLVHVSQKFTQEELRQERGRGSELQEILTDQDRRQVWERDLCGTSDLLQDHDLAQQLQNFACKVQPLNSCTTRQIPERSMQATISSPTSPAQQQDEDPPEAGGPEPELPCLAQYVRCLQRWRRLHPKFSAHPSAFF